MDRFFARNRLSAFVDGTLAPDEAREVERAISRNPDLAAEHAALQLTRKLMKKEGRVTAPRGFHARVMTQMATEPPPGSQLAWLRARLSRVPTEAIVLVAAALVVGIVVHQRSAPETSEMAVASAPKAKRAAKRAKAKAKAATTRKSAKRAADVPPDIPHKAASEGEIIPVAGPGTTSNDEAVPAGPVGYRFLGRGDEVLYEIGTLADEVGGRLVDERGEVYRPHSLSEIRNFVRAFLVFPKSQAGKVHRRLHQRSGQDAHHVDGRIPTVLADESTVLIAVQR